MARLPSTKTTALVSSALLRFFSYVFLRWIPGHHLPPLILASCLIYISCCYYEMESWSSPKTNGQARGAELPKEKEHSTVQHRDQGTIFTLVSGLPNPRKVTASLVTAGTNVLLVIMALDLVYRAPLLHASEDLSFMRLGYVDGNSAKLVLREHREDRQPIAVTYREANSTWKIHGTFATLNESADYTQAITLSGLRVNTDYEYASSNGHSGTFRTAPRVGQTDPKTSKLTFVTTSCLKPHFPYNPLDHPLRVPGLEHLAAQLPRLKAAFMLFLGDFIYVDVPRRMGTSPANYRREYRQVYASPSWQAASAGLPWLHVMDDHEIANDWDRGDAAPYPAALDPFTLYQHAANPSPVAANETFYTFKHGPASFFLLDTRRHRMPSAGLPATHPDKTMLGAAQLAAVRTWLAAPEPRGVRWKIMVSSVPFTRNWRFNAADTWAGYLFERQTILEAMWDAASGTNPYGVVVLSGDRHEFAATRFPAPVTKGDQRKENAAASGWSLFRTKPTRWLRSDGSAAVVHEFSCSPLNMFYLPYRSYSEVIGESSDVGVGGEDQRLAYIPEGNSKFGAVDIWHDTREDSHILRYTVYIDGKEAWNTTLVAGGT